MWERFGYYGMRALLTLYLTKHFLFSDSQATGLYGGYTALVYLTPLIGGFLADQYLGSKRSVKFGAIIMAIGYFTLALRRHAGQALCDHRRPALRSRGRSFRRTGRPATRARRAIVVDHGKKLQIRGNDDGSISLLDNGQEAKRLPKGAMQVGRRAQPA